MCSTPVLVFHIGIISIKNMNLFYWFQMINIRAIGGVSKDMPVSRVWLNVGTYE